MNKVDSGKKDVVITSDTIVEEIYDFLDKWESDDLYKKMFTTKERDRVFSDWLSLNNKEASQLTKTDILDFAEHYNCFRYTEESKIRSKSGFDSGTSVLAIKSCSNGFLEHYGTGKYLGLRTPKKYNGLLIDSSSAIRHQCVELDNGLYIWGFQSWFIPTNQLHEFTKKEFIKLKKVELSEEILPWLHKN